MMMQELPMEQISGQGGEPHQTHLDRLENLKEEVGVDVKPGWPEPTDIKPPWDRKLLSPHSPPPQHRQWPLRPEEFEDEQRAKSVLENGTGGHGRPEFCEGLPEDDHYPSGPFPGPGGSPFHDGPPTPHGVHSFSPENMMMDGPPGPNNVSKKSSSRRNAWGNLSYADLITQAILSSPEKRLTLSQVYDWMVQNIPYFKDKGDSNSSAGWKNSIRHNLSLHSKFMRVQNEGTGKSSWWMVNPDSSKTGKSSRRRASNPDNGKGLDNRRRGRSKKGSMDAFGAGQESTPSPNGIVEGFPDSPLPPGFPFPHDMRLRPGSNGTEFVPGGRISPLRHEYFQEGGWPHPGHPGQEYHGNMVAYGGPPPHGFRPEFCEGGEAMMERIGMDPRMSPHPGMPPHLRPNGFPGYPRPPFHHDPSYPHSPLMAAGPNGEHFPGGHPHVSPGPGPSLSPIPQAPAPGYPSPDHTPGPGAEGLMSPHQMSHNRQFFPQGSAVPGAPPSSCALTAPDSPAPGSSSSSGSMLERALTTAKQEPGEPEAEAPPGPPGHHPGHHHQLHGHGQQPGPGGDWPHIASDFGDVNVQDYIKHDYGMVENIEFAGQYGHPHGPGADHPGDHPHPHPQYPHPAAQVSVAPPWVR